MNVGGAVVSYLLTAMVFFGIDLVWLGLVAKNMYNRNIGHLMSSQVNWVAAVVFYLAFIVGILVFAVYPSVDRDSLLRAIVLGVLFGFFTYSTYDLTNLATLRDWPLSVTIVDIAWGIVLTGAVSAVGFFIVKAFD
ncbi:MAG: DUF2177 family protein [Dehalococcoidia bacterium]|nr:DUF2177 family protein [Dehalococcoidia bacterium]